MTVMMMTVGRTWGTFTVDTPKRGRRRENYSVWSWKGHFVQF